MFGKLARAVAGKSTVDDDVLDDLEEVLITSDVGKRATLVATSLLGALIFVDDYFNCLTASGVQ